MILLVHLLFGAAIGSVVKNIPVAIILAFLGHYLLDLIPHIEYNIEGIAEKQWRKKIPVFIKITLDLLSGILLIFLFSKNQPILYVCAFFAILPDGFTVLNILLPNGILESHNKLHTQKVHFLKDKKISKFWRITGQIIVVMVSLVLFQI
jgi:hypothetical protein